VKRICLASIASLPALVLAMATCAASAWAAPADLDTSFGGDGIVEVEGPAGPTFPREAGARMAIGPHDEIFVLYSSYPACEPPFRCTVELTVARYDAEGRRDTTFAPGPQLTVQQNAFEHNFDLAVGADGKPVVAATDEGGGGLIVARLGLDGRLDGGFGVGGRAEHTGTHPIEGVSGAPAVAVQPDGMVLVAAEGARSSEAGTSELLLARYLATGQLDPGFGSGGEATLALRGRTRPNAVLPGAAGTIAVPAPQCCLGGTPLFGGGFSVARFLSNGQPDPGWPGGGALFYPVAPGYDGGIEAATIGPDGKLIVSFEENSEMRSTVGNLVRLMPDGSLDTSFGGGLVTVYSRVGASDPDDLVVDPEGRIVGVGWAGRVSVFRLRPEGGADRTFNGGQHLVVPYGSDKSTPYQVGLQSGGRIVVLGESGNVGGPGKGFALIALHGGTDRSKCLGKRATIVGTAKQDEIVGTPRRDVIAALGGKDKVRALAGADLICGGKGRDTLLGGPGKDLVQQDPVRRRSR
jgi:uncharacterized delta-60 repeat protein